MSQRSNSAKRTRGRKKKAYVSVKQAVYVSIVGVYAKHQSFAEDVIIDIHKARRILPK